MIPFSIPSIPWQRFSKGHKPCLWFAVYFAWCHCVLWFFAGVDSCRSTTSFCGTRPSWAFSQEICYERRVWDCWIWCLGAYGDAESNHAQRNGHSKVSLLRWHHLSYQGVFSWKRRSHKDTVLLARVDILRRPCAMRDSERRSIVERVELGKKASLGKEEGIQSWHQRKQKCQRVMELKWFGRISKWESWKEALAFEEGKRLFETKKQDTLPRRKGFNNQGLMFWHDASILLALMCHGTEGAPKIVLDGVLNAVM